MQKQLDLKLLQGMSEGLFALAALVALLRCAARRHQVSSASWRTDAAIAGDKGTVGQQGEGGGGEGDEGETKCLRQGIDDDAR